MKAQEKVATYITPVKEENQTNSLVALWQLNENFGLEIFYFLIDLATLKLTEKKGLYQTLGYFDNEFTLDNYFEIIPPIQKDIFNAHWSGLLKGLKEPKFGNPLLKQHQVITLHGIRKQNGEYLYVKRISMPFEANKTGEITTYLCLFMVVGQYEGQLFQARTVGQTAWNKQSELAASCLLPFTKKELDLLKEYATNHQLTANDLAEKWKVSYNTILSHKNNAMSKARMYLALQFPNIRTLAKQLNEMGLI